MRSIALQQVQYFESLIRVRINIFYGSFFTPYGTEKSNINL